LIVKKNYVHKMDWNEFRSHHKKTVGTVSRQELSDAYNTYKLSSSVKKPLQFLPTIEGPFNTDIIMNVILSTPLSDLSSVYNVNRTWRSVFNAPQTLKLLTNKYHIKGTVHSFKEFLKAYEDRAIFLLNKFGPIYHTYFGLFDTEVFPSTETKKDIEFLRNVFLDGDKIIFDDSGLQVTKISDIHNNESYVILYDLDKVKYEYQFILPFKTVILKYEKDDWRGKPDEWYNRSSRWWKNNRSPHLPYLNTRPYIVVDSPFMHVTVSGDLKGEELTIDDVLFATRALALDDTRTINNGYKILLRTNDTLVLEPDMDNSST